MFPANPNEEYYMIPNRSVLSKIIILKLYLFIFLNCFSQNNYKNYTTVDGLPSPQVYKILQDDLGYLWFLTDKGVSRYDGYFFENFNKADGLTDNVFFDAQKMADGTIWLLALNNTLSQIDPYGPKFLPYEFNDTLTHYKPGIPDHFTIDKEGLNIHFIFKNGVLRISNNGQIISLPKDYDYAKTYNFVISSNGLFYNSDDGQFESGATIHPIKYKILRENFGFLMPDGKHAIFANNHDSISILAENNTFINFYRKHAISGGPLTDENFWIGSVDNGVTLFSTQGKQIRHEFDSLSITDVFMDNHGTYWFSTLNNGVYQEIPSNIKKFPLSNGTDDFIQELECDHEGRLFIAQKKWKYFYH